MELDMDGNVQYLSRNWETIVGTNIKKIMGRPVSKIIVGVSADDTKVFNTAIDQMVRDDGSYKVKFVTATNDRVETGTGNMTPQNSLNGDHDEEDARNAQEAEVPSQLLSQDWDFATEDPNLSSQIPTETLSFPPGLPKIASTDHKDDGRSLLSSQLSNNGDIIELEAQGILIHDASTHLPSHSIWTIKPFVHVDVDLTIPLKLSNMLGFGAEIFEGYLSNLQELGIIDEDAVPQPKLALCRICEQNIPAWFIERHSDLCIVEHRFSEELQECHEAVAEQRNLILRISDSLWLQLQSSSGTTSATGSSSSLSLNSSGSSLIHEYKGLRLPAPTDAPTKVGGLSLPSMVLTPSPLGGSGGSRPSRASNRRFPFGILQKLLDLCDEVMQINPADSGSDGQFQFSPNTKQAMDLVSLWQAVETNDPALRAMAEDTQQLASDKIETARRLLSMLQYSQKIKNEVDNMVLGVVHETVTRIREQTLHERRERTIMGETDSIHGSAGDRANKIGLEDEPDILRPPSIDVITDKPRASPDLLSPEAETVAATPHDTAQLSSTPHLPIHSPQPARTLSPTYIASEVPTSITPQDILLRDQRAVSQNVLPNDLSERLVEALNDLDLSKKSSFSNNSSYCSPRRHLSPAPYLEKGSLLSLQKNTSSRVEGNTRSSSPMGDTREADMLSTPATGVGEKRRLESGGATNLHLNLGKAKPPLSPLLVLLTPTGKSLGGQIKDYEVVKAISKGAFGLVFLARRKLTGDYVAIKCLKKRDMIAKNQVLNVRLERAVMMKQADLPYVAQLYSSFQTKDYLYLVMEYLNGGDCATLLKMLGTLGNEWGRRYVAEVVVGVSDLHARGIIHRDLKPDNLLIDSKGHLKLTDFGLSRMGVVGRLTRPHRKSSTSEQGIELFRRSVHGNQSPLPAGDSPITSAVDKRAPVTPFSLSPAIEAWKEPRRLVSGGASGSSGLVGTPGSGGSGLVGWDSPLVRPFAFDDDDLGNASGIIPTSYALYDPAGEKGLKQFVGTPDYLAPETIEGVGQSEASDWWLLGCIMFEFLYGYPPFHANTPDEVFQKILACDIDWPNLSPEEDAEICPPEAKDLISRLLTLDPQQRLGSKGAREIQQHPYFRGVNWDTLFSETPSFVPNVEDPELTDYFDARGADISHFPKDEDNDYDVYHRPGPFLPPLSAPMESFGGSGGLGAGSLGCPAGSAPRERRGSRLAEPSEFGLFHFRNLLVLEKANKDTINRLKTEHLEHRGSFSSSLSELTPLARPRGLSFTSPGTALSPFKRPLSPGALLGLRIPSPLKDEKDKSERTDREKSDRFDRYERPERQFKHERMGSGVSAVSAISAISAASALSTHSTHSYSSDESPQLPYEQRPPDKRNRHGLTKQVFTKSMSELSPSSSDTEDSVSLALLRVQRRRESLRKSSTGASHMSRYGSADIRPELDVLYCEPIPIVRHTNVRFLEEAGCLVVAVADGDELIRRATSQVKFDVIFTALRVPKVDGVDAAKLIKYTSGANSGTPLVAITGYGREATQAGVFAEVLEKPLDRGKLQLVLYRLCAENPVESEGE